MDFTDIKSVIITIISYYPLFSDKIYLKASDGQTGKNKRKLFAGLFCLQKFWETVTEP